MIRRAASILVLAAGCRSSEPPGVAADASAAPASPSASGPIASASAASPVPATGVDATDESAGRAATGRPIVDLSGEAAPPPPAPDGAPRLASLALATDVRRRADPKSPRVGVLRAGSIVELAKPEIAGTAGCPGGW